MERLLKVAETMRVRIEVVDPGPGRLGSYSHRRRTIRLRPGMNRRQARSVLAHELAHAHRGDEPTGSGWMDLRAEREADRLAAEYLIEADEVRIAEVAYGPNWPAIAYELEVSDHLLAVWRAERRRKVTCG